MLDSGERGKLGYRENTSQSGVENQQVQPKYGVEDGIAQSSLVKGECSYHSGKLLPGKKSLRRPRSDTLGKLIA